MNKDRLDVHRKLVEVERQICGVFEQLLTPTDLGDEATSLLLDRLGRMLESTREMQRTICSPAVVEGYRSDAAEQILRVGELINGLELWPSHEQMRDIGLAAELAAEKVRAYRAAANHAALASFLSNPRPFQEAA